MITENIPPRRNSSILIAFSFLTLLLLALSTLAYYVALGKVNLGNPTLNAIVTRFVFQVPFFPKTPKFLLQATAEAHQRLSRNSFDLSLAATSNDFQQALGGNQLDLQVKGYADYSQPTNPQFNLDLNVTKQLSLEARKKDKMVYLKVNQIPIFLTAIIGLDPAKSDEILSHWIAYDISPLDTEARRNLPQLSPAPSATNRVVTEAVTKLLDDEVLPLIKVDSEKLEGVDTYRLTFQPTSDQLDKIYTLLAAEYAKDSSSPSSITKQLPSETIRNFNLSLWINRHNYYTAKALVTFEAKSNSSSAVSGPIPSVSQVVVAIAIKLSDYGQVLPIETPPQSISFEDYYRLVMENSTFYKNQLTPVQSAANAALRNDVLELGQAIERYYVTSDRFPATIDDLIRAGELKPSFKNGVAEEILKFKINYSKKAYLVYALNLNDNAPNSTTPYVGFSSLNNTYRPLTQSEVDNF